MQPPVAHAPKIGKPLARPVLAGHPPVPQHHLLAKQNPHAPPNPTPAPVAPFSPNPNPSQVAIVTPAPAQVAQVPASIPTAPPLIAPQRVASAPPTIAPPTAAPTAKPSAAPSAQPTAKPVQPTAAPSAQPTNAPVAATSAPTIAPAKVATAAPKAVAEQSPSPQKPLPGIASPAPTGAPKPSTQHGQNASPGPKPLASSGAAPVRSPAKPQAPRPIQIASTPVPTARPSPSPRPLKTLPPAKTKAYGDLNSRLKGLLPNGPVQVHVGHYTPKSYFIGYPTPPPQVLAATKFLYENKNVKGFWRIFGGQEQRVVMYVTGVKNHGAMSTCTGWLIRFPLKSGPYRAAAASGPFRGGPVVADQPGPPGNNQLDPVVEENVTFECETARLQKYVPGASAGSAAP